MSDQITFYFDFSSPYGYIASERIEAMAERHDYRVCWRPILLGAIFKTTGARPLVDIPLIDAYTLYDLPRCARQYGVAYNHPNRFPIATVAACRGFYWLETTHPGLASAYVHAVLQAYFRDGLAIDDTTTLAAIAGKLGVSTEDFLVGVDNDATRARARAANEEAIAQGVFGSPMLFAGKERFFGNDRLEQLDHWLATGGW